MLPEYVSLFFLPKFRFVIFKFSSAKIQSERDLRNAEKKMNLEDQQVKILSTLTSKNFGEHVEIGEFESKSHAFPCLNLDQQVTLTSRNFLSHMFSHA